MKFKIGDQIRILKKETVYRDTISGFQKEFLKEHKPHKVIHVEPGVVTVKGFHGGSWSLGSEHCSLWKNEESKLPNWF
jgi:hypothetical protein